MTEGCVLARKHEVGLRLALNSHWVNVVVEDDDWLDINHVPERHWCVLSVPSAIDAFIQLAKRNFTLVTLKTKWGKTRSFNLGQTLLKNLLEAFYNIFLRYSNKNKLERR